jgi:heptaprenyl diphosphate synthase
MKHGAIHRLTFMATLTAIALTIFVLEAQLPTIVPIPGVKLGLANIVTVWAMFALGPGPTALILLARVILGSLFSGGMTIFYSLAGGLCCYLVMLLLRKLVTPRQIWVCSVLGSAAHNLGQLAVAVVVTRTWAVAVYLPVLMLSGILTGLFTGLCAQFLLGRLENIRTRSR